MSRKKILWLCSWYPNKTEPYNGDFIQRHAVAASLLNDIHVIHVAGCAPGSLQQNTEEEISRKEGLTEHLIYFRRSTSFWGRLIAHKKWLRYYRQAVKQYMAVNGLPDLVHVHIPLKAGMAALEIKRKHGIPFVLTEHWGIYNDVAEDNYQKRNRFFKRLVRRIVDEAAAFISVSAYLAEGVNNLVTQKKYRIIPNVANTDLFYLSGVPDKGFRFIHVSNMVPLKNTQGILRAFKEVRAYNKETELVMVGDMDPGPREFAQQLDLPLGAVQFRGEIPYPGVAREMQQSHCLMLFSNIENSPCVIGEALCCGIPVIATTVGGIPELVNDCNGILVEPGNINALVNSMKEVIENYQRFNREDIAKAASDTFSYQSVSKKLDDVYDSVLSVSVQ